jgi:hypothetical protein
VLRFIVDGRLPPPGPTPSLSVSINREVLRSLGIGQVDALELGRGLEGADP